MNHPNRHNPTASGPGNPLLYIGTLGAILALAILAASVLLRLSTVVDGGTVPGQSMLPSAAEHTVRMIHRLAATGMGLLGLLAVVFWWRARPLPPGAGAAVAGLLSATVMLAAIGPLTPGYRFTVVTVANVAGGSLLLMFCWWLRESMAVGARTDRSRGVFPFRAFSVFLIHIASGATASALAMGDVRWTAFIHVGSAVPAILIAGGVLRDAHGHGRAAMSSHVAVLSLLLPAQILLGLALLVLSNRPVWLGFLHATISPLLIAALVSVEVRGTGNGKKPWPCATSPEGPH